MQKRSKKLETLLIVLLTGALVNCSHVTIYDKEVCADLGYVGAECAHTYTEGTRQPTKGEWDHERVGWFCMSPDSFNDTETGIDQLCTTSKLCDYETQQRITRAKKNLAPLRQKSTYMREKAIK